jgi:hypothetical protein
MLKKTLLGLLFTAFAAALVVGGIYRTGERTAITASAADHDHLGETSGHDHEDKAAEGEALAAAELSLMATNESEASAPLPPPAVTTTTYGNAVATTGTAEVAAPSDPTPFSRGNGGESGQSQPAGPGLYGGEGQAQVDDWVTLAGEVTAVTPEVLHFTTDDGTPVLLEGRAWFYLQEQAFVVKAGDTVSVTGFYDQDRFEAGAVTNVTTGNAAQVRDVSGRPAWAGRGGGGARDG